MQFDYNSNIPPYQFALCMYYACIIKINFIFLSSRSDVKSSRARVDYATSGSEVRVGIKGAVDETVVVLTY